MDVQLHLEHHFVPGFQVRLSSGEGFLPLLQQGVDIRPGLGCLFTHVVYRRKDEPAAGGQGAHGRLKFGAHLFCRAHFHGQVAVDSAPQAHLAIQFLLGDGDIPGMRVDADNHVYPGFGEHIQQRHAIRGDDQAELCLGLVGQPHVLF